MPSGRGNYRGPALAFCCCCEGACEIDSCPRPLPAHSGRTHTSGAAGGAQPPTRRAFARCHRWGPRPTLLTAAPRAHRAPAPRRSRPHAVRGRGAGGGARAPTPLTAAIRTHRGPAPRRSRSHAVLGRGAGGGARAATRLTAAPRTNQAPGPRRNRAHELHGRISYRCFPPPQHTRIDRTRLAGAGDVATRHALTHCPSRGAWDSLTPPHFSFSASAHLLRDQLAPRPLRCFIFASWCWRVTHLPRSCSGFPAAQLLGHHDAHCAAVIRVVESPAPHLVAIHPYVDDALRV